MPANEDSTKEINVVEIKRENGETLRSLFSWSEESLLESFYDNQFGCAVADNESPTCAMIFVAGFAFLGGDAKSSSAKEIASFIPEGTDWIIIVTENEEWAELVKECYAGKYEVWNRYAIKKEGDIFDRAKLHEYAKSLENKYEIKRIDSELYKEAVKHELFIDFVCNFDSEEDFLRRGVGFVALDNGKIVGGASTYTMYNRGIEVEVDTAEEYRNQGIAAACSATLILHCLENGLYPSWDAANMTSVRLAERLGYHLDHEYLCYAVDVEALRKSE